MRLRDTHRLRRDRHYGFAALQINYISFAFIGNARVKINSTGLLGYLNSASQYSRSAANIENTRLQIAAGRTKFTID